MIAVLAGIVLNSCGYGINAEFLASSQEGKMSVMNHNKMSIIKQNTLNKYTADTPVGEVISDSVFADYGRLIFPVNKAYYNGNTLRDLRLMWCLHIDPHKTVEITNYLRNHAAAGRTNEG